MNIKNTLEVCFWKFARGLLKRGYGYCNERTTLNFREKGRCGACDASDVQDWIQEHINLIMGIM